MTDQNDGVPPRKGRPAPTTPEMLLVERKPFLTLSEAAWLIALTPEGLRARLRRKQLPAGVALRVGGRSLRFDRAKLVEWARSNPVIGGS